MTPDRPEPELGFITFVDTDEVESENPGYCYQCAGWERVGHTKGGLVALQLIPEKVPAPETPMDATMKLRV